MAGFLDTLTSAFTGQPQQDAAEAQRQYLAYQAQQTANAIQGATGKSIADLKSGQAGALGAIAPAIATARGDISSSVDPAIAALYGGQGNAVSALTGAVDPAIAALYGGLGNVTTAYAPLSGAAGQFGAAWAPASAMSADALGLNGPEGVARAQAAFQTGPGYQFSLNQGLESIMRNAAAAGMPAGGNVLRESQTFGQGLANQQYQQWLQSLATREGQYAPLWANALQNVASGVGNAALTAGTGAANVYTGTGGRLSDLYSTIAGRAAPIYTGAGQSLADLAKTGGLAAADIYGKTAQAEADLRARMLGQQVGYTESVNPLATKTYADAAAAITGGSKNLWNLIGSLATASSKGLGGLTPTGSATGLPNLLPYGMGTIGGAPGTPA